MELVTVRDGSRTVYVEKNLIKQVVIHPQIQQVPGAPAHICGIMLYERIPVVFFRLGDSGSCACGFILLSTARVLPSAPSSKYPAMVVVPISNAARHLRPASFLISRIRRLL